MGKRAIPVRFPLRGLSENLGFGDQEPGTTRLAQNVRGIDPKTGRERGAQRSGMAPYITGAVSGANNKVQDLGQVTFHDQTDLTYSDSSTHPLVWSKTLSGEVDCPDVKIDDFGNIYAMGAVQGVDKFNADGTLLTTISIPEGTSASVLVPMAVAVDEFQNVFIAIGQNSDTVAEARLFAFENMIDGSYQLRWSLDTGNYIQDVAIHNGDIYTIEATARDGTSGNGHFRVYRDYGLFTAPASADVDVTLFSAGTRWPRRMAVRDDGIAYIASCDHLTTATTVNCFLAKVNPDSDTPGVVWEIVGASGTDDVAGIGYSVAVGPKNADGLYTVYSYGPQGTSTDAGTNVRRIEDTGTSFDDATGTDNWEVGLVTELLATPRGVKTLRMAVDEDDRLYVPYGRSTATDVSIFDTDGTELNSTGNKVAGTISLCCAVPRTKPDYGSATIEETEFVYLGQSATSGNSFYKIRLVDVADTQQSLRATMGVAVANGNILQFDLAAGSPPVSAYGTPANGTGVSAPQLSATAPYVQSAVAFQKLYFTDGLDYRVFDPKEGANGTVEQWLATTQGLIPARCRLIEMWRGRMVLARDPDDPQNWHMSAIGDVNNWDQFPNVITASQAISGNNARSGRVPDIVNTIIPYNDDLMFFGGDKSIWRMTGDPMAGGQMDLLTDETGIAFGRPWVKDPMGRLYWFGSRGGVYMMLPGQMPQRLTRDRIERRMQDLDLSTFYVRLVWNYREEGLHVFVVPYGAGGTTVQHWFWDSKADAWWEDEIGNTSYQPTAVFQLDGDAAGDRRVLLGAEDGEVRFWDEDSEDDDDQAIDSFVTIGPLAPQSLPYETKFSRYTQTLADDQDGLSYEFYTQDEPNLLGAPTLSGSLGPGRNPTKAARFRGTSCWLKLRNAYSAQRWAMEEGQIWVAPGGRKRTRL